MLKPKQEGIIWYQNQTIIQQFFFSENVLAIEMKRTRIFINKHVYLALLILEIVMHDFWYDYVGPKYG